MLGHSQQHVYRSVRVCKLVFLYRRGGPSLLQSSPLFSAFYNQTEKKTNQKKASPPPLLYLSQVAELVAPSSPIALRVTDLTRSSAGKEQREGETRSFLRLPLMQKTCAFGGGEWKLARPPRSGHRYKLAKLPPAKASQALRR